jgi:membrane protease subunit HflC
MKTAGAMAAIVILVLGVASTPYSVDRSEFAYVTQFGRPVAVRDGAAESGLHFKWPWPIQSVQRIDRRLQMFDLPAAELPTFDPQGQTIDKMLTVDGYVAWRIDDAAGVDQFIRTIGDTARAREILGPRIAGRIGAIISQMKLDDLIHVGEGNDRIGEIDARSQKLQQRLLAGDGFDDLRQQIREEYGISVIDVRLRRLNYPDSVRQAIFDRIRSERKRKAADYESDGEKRAREIRSAAERDAEIIRATAQAKADLIRKQADADADRIRNEAHAKDRDFYVFLQKLETYTQMLGKTSDLLLLSSRHPLFQLLLNPPSENDKKPVPKAGMEALKDGAKRLPQLKPGG